MIETTEEIEKRLLAVLNNEDEKQGATKMNSDLLKEWSKQVSEPRKSEKGNSKFYKACEGKNTLRLLPGEYGETKLPFVIYKQTYVGGKYYVLRDGENPFTVEGWRLHNEFKDSNPAEAKKARQKWLPSDTVAVNVLVDGAAKIWVTSPTRMQEIIALMDDWGDFFSLDEGRDIVLTRTGTGLLTKYAITPGKDESKIEMPADAIDLNTWIEEQYASPETMAAVVAIN
jgi:hypothetical protein